MFLYKLLENCKTFYYNKNRKCLNIVNKPKFLPIVFEILIINKKHRREYENRSVVSEIYR